MIVQLHGLAAQVFADELRTADMYPCDEKGARYLAESLELCLSSVYRLHRLW